MKHLLWILVPFFAEATIDLVSNPSDKDLATLASDTCASSNGYDFTYKVQGYCVVQKYILQVERNEQVKVKDTMVLYRITQKEQQEWIRLIHNYKIDSLELLKLKIDIREHAAFKNLSQQSQSEIESAFYDVIQVSQRMEEYRSGQTAEYPGIKMHCRFALRNDPLEEIPKDSIFVNPQRAALMRTLLPNSFGLLSSDQKSTVGFCWLNAKNDSLL